MRRFCAKCGVEESDGTPIINGLCLRCFIETHTLSKGLGGIRIRYCDRCGAVFYNNKWVAQEAYPFKDVVGEAIAAHLRSGERVKVVDIDIDLPPYEDTVARVRALFQLDGRYRLWYEVPIAIQWIKTSCPSCLKRAGGGYDSIIQIRYMNWAEDIAGFMEEIMNVFNEYVAGVEEVKNGYNIKLIDAHIARRIADLARRRWSNVRVATSYGDVKRRRDGSRYSRLYISIKILNFKKGDYVVLNGKPYRVESVNDREIAIVDQDGKLYRVGIDEVVSSYRKSRIKHSG